MRRNGTYPGLVAALVVDENVVESGLPLVRDQEAGDVSLRERRCAST